MIVDLLATYSIVMPPPPQVQWGMTIVFLVAN